jgi:hypothetical protein
MARWESSGCWRQKKFFCSPAKGHAVKRGVAGKGSTASGSFAPVKTLPG